MDIALDLRAMALAPSGIATYIKHLLLSLKKMDSRNCYHLICSPHMNLELSGIPACFNLLTSPFAHDDHPLGDVWRELRLPSRLAAREIDLFHGPAFLIPLRKKGFKTLTTIHDLVAFTLPELLPKRYSLYMRTLIRLIVSRANLIIVDSHAVREELLALFPSARPKVMVIPLGLGGQFKRVDDEGALKKIRSKYGLGDKVIFSLGPLEPRKNHLCLLKALSLLLKEMPQSPYQLVIGGPKSWHWQKLFSFVETQGLKGKVKFIGPIPEEDAPLLYSLSEVFVFPSLGEGFGLPLLEAMGCQTPLIASDIKVHREVAGQAALYFNPHEPESLAQTLMQLLTTPSLYQSLKKEGLKRSSLFSWEETARLTLQAYNQVYAS